MEPGIATQLITAGATLGGVVLTLLVTAFLERRRARDARGLETLRLKTEHVKWLRDERVNAYGRLSVAGEDVLQFFRTELLRLVELGDASQSVDEEVRWHRLRAELRKAYNRVALLGVDDARSAGLEIWRTARDGGNDFFRSLDRASSSSGRNAELSEHLKSAASRLGTVGDRFLEACRRDIQENVIGAVSRQH
jgi:hypothetical protein